jgi:hypothetical protein
MGKLALAGRARRSRIDKSEMISNKETIFATVEIQTDPLPLPIFLLTKRRTNGKVEDSLQSEK